MEVQNFFLCEHTYEGKETIGTAQNPKNSGSRIAMTRATGHIAIVHSRRHSALQSSYVDICVYH